MNCATELSKLQSRPIVIASHRRSGTHLTIDLLRRQFEPCDAWKRLGESNSRLYLDLESLYHPFGNTNLPLTESKAVEILSRTSRPLIKTHVIIDEIKTGPATRVGELGQHWLDFIRNKASVIYAYRDGRDVLCSDYLLHHIQHKIPAEKRISLSEFMRIKFEGMNWPAYWSHHATSYLKMPNVILFNTKEIMKDPYRSIEQLGEKLGMPPRLHEPLLPAKFKGVWHSRFNRLFRTRPQSSAILARPKGMPLPKWRDAMSIDDYRLFAKEAGHAMSKMGFDVQDVPERLKPAIS